MVVGGAGKPKVKDSAQASEASAEVQDGAHRGGRRRGLRRAVLEPAVLRVVTDAGERGLTKAAIVAVIRGALGTTSAVSIQRALTRLRDEHDAPIAYVAGRWRLRTPFTMPLESPEAQDVVAVLLARAILEPLGDAEMLGRVDRLVEQLDARVRARVGAAGLPPGGALSSTLTLGTTAAPGVLRALLDACRRRALRIAYASPWKPANTPPVWVDIEPWALRVHDGAAYLRAWRRDTASARTYRVAHIDAIDPCPHELEAALVPVAAEIWGEADPAYGIDLDRPATAVVVLHGAVARWVHRVRWHPGQRDRWLLPGEILERTVAYRSARELARRIASVFDGVRTIEPAALRDAVAAILRGHTDALSPAVFHRVVPARARARIADHAADE